MGEHTEQQQQQPGNFFRNQFHKIFKVPSGVYRVNKQSCLHSLSLTITRSVYPQGLENMSKNICYECLEVCFVYISSPAGCFSSSLLPFYGTTHRQHALPPCAGVSITSICGFSPPWSLLACASCSNNTGISTLNTQGSYGCWKS